MATLVIKVELNDDEMRGLRGGQFSPPEHIEECLINDHIGELTAKMFGKLLKAAIKAAKNQEVSMTV